MEVLKEAVESTGKWREPTLRMSKIGTPDRKLWYEMNGSKKEDADDVGGDDTFEGAPIDPSLQIKFLYGHLLEELVLFFCREAGHDVTGEQDELDVGGIKGHRDCKIDNVTVDVKSASRFAFQKFSTGSLFKDDPFGYIPQISGYTQADPTSEDFGAFLAINKESGELCILKVDPIDMVNAEMRIDHVKGMVELDAPPDTKCYQPKPVGKAGNMAVHTNCSYCPFMKDCWKDANGGTGIRSFKYSNKTEHLTTVVKLPNVPEVT